METRRVINSRNRMLGKYLIKYTLYKQGNFKFAQFDIHNKETLPNRFFLFFWMLGALFQHYWKGILVALSILPAAFFFAYIQNTFVILSISAIYVYLLFNNEDETFVAAFAFLMFPFKPSWMIYLAVMNFRAPNELRKTYVYYPKESIEERDKQAFDALPANVTQFIGAGTLISPDPNLSFPMDFAEFELISGDHASYRPGEEDHVFYCVITRDNEIEPLLIEKIEDHAVFDSVLKGAVYNINSKIDVPYERGDKALHNPSGMEFIYYT